MPDILTRHSGGGGRYVASLDEWDAPPWSATENFATEWSMALHEHDREDLLRDGRTMVFRGACEIEGVSVLVGFRSRGQVSLYCGNDPVFQFNENGQLRRVFYQGSRLAAEGGSLVELTRDSRGGRMELNRTPINKDLQSRILAEIADWGRILKQCVEEPSSSWRVVGEETSSFHRRLGQWCDRLSGQPRIAESPNA